MGIFRVENFRVGILHGGDFPTWGSFCVNFFPNEDFREGIYIGRDITVRIFRVGIFCLEILHGTRFHALYGYQHSY